MSLARLSLLSVAACLAAALGSVVVETYQWWGYGAQSSWTIVLVAGWVICLAYGLLLARRRFRLSEVAAAAALVELSVALPLVIGFALKAAGTPVPWRMPEFDRGAWVTVIATWFALALLIMLAWGAGKLILRVWRGLRGSPRRA